MESDDDYQFFPPTEQTSPPVQHRKLKRLKKAKKASMEPIDQSADQGSVLPPLNFDSLPVESSGTPGSEERVKPLFPESPSEGRTSVDAENDVSCGIDGSLFGEHREEAKRALHFDGMTDEFDGKRPDQLVDVEENITEFKVEQFEKKRSSEKGSSKYEEKKKKRLKGVGDQVNPRTSSSSKRREEKERKSCLQQLHVESQRLLRETRDVNFKPLPVVQKPISSVLEKIRQRKLEVLKKTESLNSSYSFSEDHGSSPKVLEDREVNEHEDIMQKETTAHHVAVDTTLASLKVGESEEATEESRHGNVPSQMPLEEKSKHAFRSPVHDTQDLFSDSQTSEGKDRMSDDQNNSPLEEPFAPSLLAMKLKLDSALLDDFSSDEEDNDKENIDPALDEGNGDNSRCASPIGDPVKAFVDEEAVEEDDSDHDLLRFQDNEEDEDNEEDYEELNDLIATEYEEKPVDNERRNELHQKWLEQQDNAGTDNLLKRLKCSSVLRDTTLHEEEEEEEDNEERQKFDNEVAEDLVGKSAVKAYLRKAKQMIPQMFCDNDGYLSSDGEETEKMLVKQRRLEKVEDRGTHLAPSGDENSRELFALIRKLNTMHDPRKKPKTSSFFDNLLTKGNSSSKSSFLGRAPSHSLPSSHKQGTSTIRSFVFGRDDSNSRNSISISEDSSDAIPSEKRPSRNAKFSSSSQPKFSIQSTKNAVETVNGVSLFERLKLSSVQSSVCNPDNLVDLTQTIFAAFKIPKKPIKIQGGI